MKTIHYGEDYCKVVIGEGPSQTEFELPKMIGDGIDRMNARIKNLKRELQELERCPECGDTVIHKCTNCSYSW